MTDPFVIEMDIGGPPELVYAHFLDPVLMVRWMGEHARLDAQAGGEFSVDINGVLIRGRYLVLDPARRIEIAWGQLGNGAMPPASTRVVIELAETPTGTRLRLSHHGLVKEEEAKHAVGWPHFLARMAICAEGGEPGPDPFAS